MESSRALLKNMRENSDLEKIEQMWDSTSLLRFNDLKDISAKDDAKAKDNFIKFMSRWPLYTIQIVF